MSPAVISAFGKKKKDTVAFSMSMSKIGQPPSFLAIPIFFHGVDCVRK